ncbi:MAG: hypothetical protein E5Y50_22030, partial [Mesorhizobium sp.]
MIQSLAHNFNCLLSAQKVALVALVEGLDDPEMRNSALEEIGADLAGLPPELQQRLVALAEGLEDAEDCVFVLRGFGTGVAGLAPELQQRLLVLADGIDEPNYRALALSALGAGVTGLTPELQQRLVVLVERLDNPGHRASVLEVLGAGVAGLRPRSSCVSSSLPRDLTPCIAPELWRALQQRLVALAEGLGEPEDGARALRGFGAGLTGL